MMKKKIKAVVVLLLCVHALMILAGCITDDTEEYRVITSLDDINGCRVGVTPADSFCTIVEELYPDCELVYFTAYSDMIAGLLAGRIDAYCVDAPVGKFQISAYTGKITELEETVTTEYYGFAISKDNNELKKKVDVVISDFGADGTLDALNEKWIVNYSDDTVVEYDENATTENGTIRYITTAVGEGFTFYRDGELQGYCIELAVKIAEKLHMKAEFTVSDLSGILPAVQSGRVDIAADTLTITEERKETVDFCTSFYTGGMAFVVRDKDYSVQTQTFLDSVKSSFGRTFITESRWKMILSGLLVTFKLVALSIVLGTFVGFFYSFALRSNIRWLKWLSKKIGNIRSCTPMIVILMVLYYIIFASSSLSAEIVAIIGFTLTFGNTVAGLLNTGVEAVSKGQIEAATALGYRKFRIFTKIVLPQAASMMFDQYKAAIIGLVKDTAIVGYITIEDLTRVSDIIRGRTYEAFFPLIATAILYYLLAQLLLALLTRIGDHVNPQNRKNVLKGVKTK